MKASGIKWFTFLVAFPDKIVKKGGGKWSNLGKQIFNSDGFIFIEGAKEVFCKSALPSSLLTRWKFLTYFHWHTLEF